MTNVITAATRFLSQWNTVAPETDVNLYSPDDLVEYIAHSSFLGATVFNVMDPQFGARCDMTGNDQPAIMAAIDAAKASGLAGVVVIPGIARVTQGFSLDTYPGIVICGPGGNRGGFLKAFNGPLFTLSNCLNFEAHGLYVNGQYGTYTGKGFVLTGNCNYPVFDNCFFLGLSDAHIEFGPNAGYYAKVNTQHFTGQGQPDFPSVRVAGPDTTATPRRFNIESNGYVDLQGAFDTRVNGGFVTRVQTDDACSITLVNGTVWANNGVAMTIRGDNTTVIGCRMSGDVTLASGMSGAFADNIQTQGTFTDSTTAGNALVRHHPLSTNYTKLDKHTLAVFPAQEVQVTASNGIGDTDYSFDPNASSSTMVFNVSFTANRTVTLVTTNARNGQRARIARSGGNTGGPWTLTIGVTGKTLATAQWCDVQYNGSFWEIIGFGSL